MSTQADFGHIPERTLGRRLRDAREDTGMSQSQFAEATGISQRSVSRYEQATDLAEVKRPAMMAWAMATGVPLSWLQTGIAPTDDGPGVTPRLAQVVAISTLATQRHWQTREGEPLRRTG